MPIYPWKNKLLTFGCFMAAYLIFYILPNLRPVFPPIYLPLFGVDEAIPLLPWTFLVYLSDYPLFLVVMALIDDPDQFRALTRKCFGVLFLCGAFFLLMPTRYPRPEYPAVDNPILAFVMHLISSADTPNNCFPSMHVSLTGVATWQLRHRGPRVFGCFLLWSLAIFLSTLTTKQHYLLDVVGGIGVVAVVSVVDWALFESGLVRAWWERRQLEQKSLKPRS